MNLTGPEDSVEAATGLRTTLTRLPLIFRCEDPMKCKPQSGQSLSQHPHDLGTESVIVGLSGNNKRDSFRTALDFEIGHCVLVQAQSSLFREDA